MICLSGAIAGQSDTQQDALPPHAVLIYTPDKACFS